MEYLVSFRGLSGRSVALITHPDPVPRIKKEFYPLGLHGLSLITLHRSVLYPLKLFRIIEMCYMQFVVKFGLANTV